jgi:hypothetical protein
LKPEKFVTPGGFTCSAIGQKIALEFDQTWAHPAEWKDEHVEHNNFPWSWLHEEIFEWIALAESVRAAREKFTMVELGAGYGRWLVAGAMLARRLRPGLPVKLIGVEAEQVHFAWMRRHFIDNGLDVRPNRSSAPRRRPSARAQDLPRMRARNCAVDDLIVARPKHFGLDWAPDDQHVAAKPSLKCSKHLGRHRLEPGLQFVFVFCGLTLDRQVPPASTEFTPRFRWTAKLKVR